MLKVSSKMANTQATTVNSNRKDTNENDGCLDMTGMFLRTPNEKGNINLLARLTFENSQKQDEKLSQLLNSDKQE